jgi:peroxiredoxin Q/BCP
MKAADFSLPDENGTLHTLSQNKGKWVVVYFYPKDDTPCFTKESCGFRDNIAELKKLGVVIFGISKDSVTSHKKFSEKFSLSFPLLSDESKKTIIDYNAWGEKKFLGKTFQGILRKTFLIDPMGEIKKVYEKVNPTIHAQEIINDIKTLQ